MLFLLIPCISIIDASPIPAEKSLRSSAIVDTSPFSPFDFPWKQTEQFKHNVNSAELSLNQMHSMSQILKNVMSWLPFKDAYQLVSRTKGIRFDNLNPLGDHHLSPLTYHDATADEQKVLDKVLSLEPKLLLKYMHYLLKNPTVDFSKLDESVLRLAIRHGDVQLVKEFLLKKIFAENLILNAAFQGNLDLLKELLYSQQLDSVHLASIYRLAISMKNYEMAKYLIENCGVAPSYFELCWLAEHGDYDFVKFVIENYHVKVGPGTLWSACRGGSLPLVKYLLQLSDHLVDRTAVFAAAGAGHAHIVKHLIEKEMVPFDIRMLHIAQTHRRENVKEYLEKIRKV